MNLVKILFCAIINLYLLHRAQVAAMGALNVAKYIGLHVARTIAQMFVCTMKPPKIKGNFHGTYLINHGQPWFFQINHG